MIYRGIGNPVTAILSRIGWWRQQGNNMSSGNIRLNGKMLGSGDRVGREGR